MDPFDGLEKRVRAIRGVVPKELLLYRISSWYELEENQYRSFRTTKALLVFIMFMIVLVASVNVSSTMVLIVMEKTQEIGILKSMGAGPRVVSLAFLMTGFLTGVAGAALGIAAGLLIAVNINEVIRGLEQALNVILRIGEFLALPGPDRPVMLLDPAFYLEVIPIRIGLTDMFFVSALAVFVATGAAYFPARRAGRIKPLEVLRKI